MNIQIMEVVLVAILLLADYYLTLLGSYYRKKKFGEYYDIETYELNPLWKKDIDNLKLFNYKHVLIVIVLTGYLYFLSISDDVDLYQLMLGYFFTVLGFINGRHLNNIFLFRFIYKHSNEVSGKVYQSHLLGLKMAQYHIFIVLMPILLLTILQPNYYLYGGLVGLLMLFIVILFWIRKHKNKIAR